MTLKKVGLVSVLLMAIFALSTIPELVSTQDQWFPYKPEPEHVELSFWSVHKTAYVNVTLTFGTPCYRFDWGTVYRENDQLWANSKIWVYQGICLQVITTFEHTYELGELKYGKTYTFIFKAWGYSVESITFKHLPTQAHR